MTERTLGEIVDALGCEHDLEADTLVTGAILILHTVTATGLEDVVEIESENLSWVWECGCWADEDRQPVCSSCTDSDPLGRVTPSAYPCETVRALTAHLDLTDPEGDPT